MSGIPISNHVRAFRSGFIVQKGDTLEIRFEFWEDEAATIKTPNIDAGTWSMVVKDQNDKEVLLFTSASGITIENENIVVCKKSAAEIDVIRAGIYHYWLKQVDDGVVVTNAKGTFEVEK